MQKISPRTQAAIYVVLTFAISWSEQYYTIHAGIGQNSIFGFALMWTPGAVAIVLSLIFKNFGDLALRRPDLKSLALAYSVPAMLAFVAWGLVIAFQLSDFEMNPGGVEKMGGIGKFLAFVLLLVPTVYLLRTALSALGEEIGWRGFLHSKLLGLNPNRRYLLTGAIWSVWHWPLILFGDYSTSARPALSVAIFTVMIVSSSFFIGFLRDRSKSVFPAALAHGAHNIWFLGITPLFFKPGPLAPYFAGEAGVFCALLYAGLAVVIARRRPAQSLQRL